MTNTTTRSCTTRKPRAIRPCSHLKQPFYGSRRIRGWLEDQGHSVNRKPVQRLMRTMGLTALYPKRNLSLANQAYKARPYLLKDLVIDRPSQVGSTDITFVPMARGFVYLVAIMDWYSRRVLSWRVSTTLDTGFCVDALEEAIQRHGAPEIFNTDQGSQFTSEGFTGVLKQHDIRISMDGKSRWVHNVFVERLWRSVNYQEVYLKAYDSIVAARASLGKYFMCYNTQRRHQSLDRQTPDSVYYQDAASWRLDPRKHLSCCPIFGVHFYLRHRSRSRWARAGFVPGRCLPSSAGIAGTAAC